MVATRRLFVALATIVPSCLAFSSSSLMKKPTFLKMSTTAEQPAIPKAPETSKKNIRLGIFGGGTVGGGIVDIIQNKAKYFDDLTAHHIDIRKICVRDATKSRDFTVPPTTQIVTDYNDILEDEEIDVVVEVMGGTSDAKDVVYAALRKGKDVVTANKALIAAHLPEIEGILDEVNDGSREKNVEFRYEAAVCGGIPVIRSLQSDFVGDDVSMISGIINGCTNFMLTAMDRDNKSYDEALAEASELGYAEADPTLDVGGFDARSKLRILMRLAYGVEVDEKEIACRGITELTKVDFEYAKMLGGTIKLLGVAERVAEDKIAAFVSPCYVTADDPLFAVTGATNAVEVLSKNLQSSTYIGQGAGRFPTANSCINDIVALAKGDSTPLPFNPYSEEEFVNDYQSTFFLRIRYADKVGITRQCGEICEKYDVSIHSILQNPVTSRQDAAFVLITEKVSLNQIKQVCSEIEKLDWCAEDVFYMPVLREDWMR